MTPSPLLRVTTASGSVYILDRDCMMWERKNTNPGHENIRGLEGVSWGALAAWPTIALGESMHIDDSEGLWIRTTPVVSIEDEA